MRHGTRLSFVLIAVAVGSNLAVPKSASAQGELIELLQQIVPSIAGDEVAPLIGEGVEGLSEDGAISIFGSDAMSSADADELAEQAKILAKPIIRYGVGKLLQSGQGAKGGATRGSADRDAAIAKLFAQMKVQQREIQHLGNELKSAKAELATMKARTKLEASRIVGRVTQPGRWGSRVFSFVSSVGTRVSVDEEFVITRGAQPRTVARCRVRSADRNFVIAESEGDAVQVGDLIRPLVADDESN